MKRTLPDRHALYEAAVQSVDFDLDTAERLFKKKRGKPFRLLREDFCGSAWLSCRWAKRGRGRRAWGVDIDSDVLEGAKKRHIAHLGKAGRNVELIRADVRSVSQPKIDVVMALNFSYSIFKKRPALLEYFQAVHRSLTSEGVFVLDLFGGTEAMSEVREKRRIPASRQTDGSRLSPFTYIWEQASFNVLDHHLIAYIHFELRDGTRIRRAFKYDWRLWTVPELRDLLEEAGFSSSEVYVQGWDEKRDEASESFRLRRRLENQECWIAYVVGYV
jgi:SAM-dependent methyltransferase